MGPGNVHLTFPSCMDTRFRILGFKHGGSTEKDSVEKKKRETILLLHFTDKVQFLAKIMAFLLLEY